MPAARVLTMPRWPPPTPTGERPDLTNKLAHSPPPPPRESPAIGLAPRLRGCFYPGFRVCISKSASFDFPDRDITEHHGIVVACETKTAGAAALAGMGLSIGPAQPSKSLPLKMDRNPPGSAPRRILLDSSEGISRRNTLRQRISPPWVYNWMGPLAGTGSLRS